MLTQKHLTVKLLTMVFPLQLLLDLLRATHIVTAKANQPLLDVHRSSKALKSVIFSFLQYNF